MSLLYDNVPVYPGNSMVYISENFRMPSNGRRLFFDMSGGSSGKKLFLIFDGNAPVAFQNGSAVESSIHGFERLYRDLHEANLLIVNTGAFPCSKINIRHIELPVEFPDGLRGALRISLSVSACVAAADAEALANSYCISAFDPVATASHVLEKALQEEANRQIPQTIREGSPHEALMYLGDLETSICEEALKRVHRQLPWANITNCMLTLTANMDEIISNTNEGRVRLIETQNKIIDAIVACYGKTDIPSVMAQIMGEFFKANPGASPEQCIAACKGFAAILPQTTPQMLISTIHSMKLGTGGTTP